MSRDRRRRHEYRDRTPERRGSRQIDPRGPDAISADNSRINPFLQSREEVPKSKADVPGTHPLAAGLQFPFPSDPKGEFAQAMCTNACNAGAETKGIFSNLSGGMKILRISRHERYRFS